MSENSRITVSVIVAAIGGGKRTVERVIAALKQEGAIRRHGAAHGGYWEVIHD